MTLQKLHDFNLRKRPGNLVFVVAFLLARESALEKRVTLTPTKKTQKGSLPKSPLYCIPVAFGAQK